MGTTTLDTMLPQLGRTIGAYIGSFTTSTDVGTGTSVISTGLTDTGFTNNDSLNDTFIRMTSGNNDDTIRRVNDYTGSTGTVVVTGTNLTAESGDVTFEIYRYDPNQLIDALNDARVKAFPRLYREINDRTLTSAFYQNRFARPTTIRPHHVRQIFLEPRLDAKTFANNIVGTLNCDFENSTISTDWTASNITLAAESETTAPDNFMVFEGTQSGKCTVSASATATLLMTVPSGTNYVGEEINVGMWVYSRTASRVSAAIQLDSSSVSVGSTHSGAGWERLTHTLVADGVSSSIKVGVSATSGTAFVFYADNILVTAGPSEIPQSLGVPVEVWREEGDNIRVVEGLNGDRNLLVRGHGILSSVSSGSDTMEIDGEQVQLLYNIAAQTFFQGDIDSYDSNEQTEALRRWTHFRNREADGTGQMAPLALLRTVA